MRRDLVAALALILLAAGGCRSGSKRPCGPRVSCPATYVTATVEVMTASTATDGVQAILTGPSTVTMTCQPNDTGALCAWPGAVAVTAGRYSLQVSRPGAQSTRTPVEVTLVMDLCGCTFGEVQPATVMLGVSDAATD